MIIRQHNHHLQQFYNAIDALVIERFAGTDEFAAIGIAGAVMNLFLFAIVGICTGFSILLAKHYGAGDLKQFRRQHFTALAPGAFLHRTLKPGRFCAPLPAYEVDPDPGRSDALCAHLPAYHPADT